MSSKRALALASVIILAASGSLEAQDGIRTSDTRIVLMNNSGMTSTTPNTPNAVSGLSPRHFLQIENTSASGALYVFYGSQSDATAARSLVLTPGMTLMMDKIVPQGTITIFGSNSNMIFFYVEG